MILYRISNCEYSTDLSGIGALTFGGRLNSVGMPMVYLAASRSLAMLEVLVHARPTGIPYDMCIIEVDVPDNVFEAKTEFLPKGWQSPTPPRVLQQLGDMFLKQKDFLLMKVPSAIVNEEFNYLLNPRHPKAYAVKIIKMQPFSFDSRLLT